MESQPAAFDYQQRRDYTSLAHTDPEFHQSELQRSQAPLRKGNLLDQELIMQPSTSPLAAWSLLSADMKDLHPDTASAL